MIRLLDALAGADSHVVVPPPGEGAGFWAGAPSACGDGADIWLAYRLRRPVGDGRGYANVVARSSDGVRFHTVSTVTSEQFACASLERPALVRRPDGGWRMYVSCSTPNSKHWWVEALDADTPAELPRGTRTVVLPGDATEAWKDVVVHADADGWRMWACRHPLDGGDDEADRMTTWFATSDDGLAWTMRSEALAPASDSWDARGTRIADVVEIDGQWWALYDGRRTAAENWHERTGLALGSAPGQFTAVAGPVPTDAGRALRYACLVRTDGGQRAYFEAGRADGAHELRTVLVGASSA